MAKRGMYHEAGNLLKSFKEPADVAVKILASTYACNISRPEAEGLEMQLIGNFIYLWQINISCRFDGRIRSKSE